MTRLFVPVSASAKMLIDLVMAYSTKCLAIRYGISQVGIVLPRFNMVDNGFLASTERLITVLAGRFISSYTEIAPLFIQYVIAPFNFMAEVQLTFLTFSLALLGICRSIRTSLTAKPTLASEIRPFIKSFVATLTVLKLSLLCHQYDYIMEIK